MIYSLWHNLIEAYKTLAGTGMILVLFVLACACVFMARSRKKSESDTFIPFLSLFGIVGVAVSLAISYVSKISDDNRLYRLFKRALFVVLFIFAITISGKRIISSEFYKASDNAMHLDADLKEAMDVILADCQDDRVGIVSMPEYAAYFAAYSSRLDSVIDNPPTGGTSDYPDDKLEAYEELLKKNPDMRKITMVAQQYNCKYIVLDNDAYWPEIPLSQLSYTVIATCGNKDVYRYTEEVE